MNGGCCNKFAVKQNYLVCFSSSSDFLINIKIYYPWQIIQNVKKIL